MAYKAEQEVIIRVAGLSKRYGEVVAVNNIGFNVRQGELFGFLGPNGAGKTTTINMLTGLAKLDTGTIKIGGIECTGNPKAAQHLTGIVPDENNLYPELTGFENLCFCAALYGIRKIERQKQAKELLDTFGLIDAADRKFAGYSKGMKRKLTFAAGIIHQPPILFLDEPTTGIDVASARQVRQIIADLHRKGTTIFLTTHYIEEAERLCERITFIVNGQIVRTDRTVDLLQPIKGKNVLIISVTDVSANPPEELSKAFPQYQFQSVVPRQTRVESLEPINVGPIVRFLEEQGIRVIEARRHLPSLEDVFKYLKQGKTVIIDLSLKDTTDASIISTILVRKLFDNNKMEFTSNKPDAVIQTVIFVEEAQNVLSDELVKSNANPFVRCAKEGRKFGLGMVAITQRPSAISEEIRTQAENFFTFYMGNSDDIKALVKSNINYDGVISTFIQTETIPGNLYMVTSDRAFAVPVRVLEFEKLIKDKMYK